MASGKNFRNERRMPTFYVMVTAVVFVAFCLIGAWVLSSSSPSQAVDNTEVVDMEIKPKFDNTDAKETFENSAGDLTLETEEKVNIKESNPVDTEEQEEVPPKKKSKKSKPKENDVVSDDGAGKVETEVLAETKENDGSWETQANESKEERESSEENVETEEKQTEEQQPEEEKQTKEQQLEEEREPEEKQTSEEESNIKQKPEIEWTLCDPQGTTPTDYIPCLDNMKAIKALHSTKHYEHRERHCPDPAPTCLVPLPEGYRTPIRWPQSRNEVWYNNVPHPGLVSYKKDQNWVKKSKDKLIFPGGGTQFKHGALHYIDYVEKSFPDVAWGKRTRVILDVGCGVASFGGYIFDRDVLTMSFAPKDEHEAQVQLALERGIPAISSVMGTQRLVFPSNVYDAVHCARCRVPWHIEGGKLLLELNRVLRPGGYFIWSATPVYWKDDEDVQIWKEMAVLTKAICWKMVAKFVDSSTGIGNAIFQKPKTNSCYENRKKNFPPICDENDKPDAAWYVPMTACLHKIPTDDDVRPGRDSPQQWPGRLTEAPAWLSNQNGLYGKPAADDFRLDTERWQKVVKKSYLQGLGIEWQNVRNVMDMRAVYGGFAAALISQPVWVMNVVPYDAPDTLPVIFDRGLFGIYHDWCESFSSYPRTYDLLHADHLFSKLKKRCDIKTVIAEMDRLLRPGGWAIVRDKAEATGEVQAYLESLHWDVRMTFSKSTEALIAVQKTTWRPEATF